MAGAYRDPREGGVTHQTHRRLYARPRAVKGSEGKFLFKRAGGSMVPALNADP